MPCGKAKKKIFCDQILLLSIMYSEFIHVVVCFNTSFLFKAEKYSIIWRYHSLSVHSSAQGQLGCFQVLAIMNETAVNLCVQVFVWT